VPRSPTRAGGSFGSVDGRRTSHDQSPGSSNRLDVPRVGTGATASSPEFGRSLPDGFRSPSNGRTLPVPGQTAPQAVPRVPNPDVPIYRNAPQPARPGTRTPGIDQPRYRAPSAGIPAVGPNQQAVPRYAPPSGETRERSTQSPVPPPPVPPQYRGSAGAGRPPSGSVRSPHAPGPAGGSTSSAPRAEPGGSSGGSRTDSGAVPRGQGSGQGGGRRR
jgi:translation initiation factor IF-2